MNFASVLEKRYEHSRFAHFYTNSFALIRESFALIRESYAFIRESFAFIRESFALFRESFALFRESFALFRKSFALIREKYNFFLYENEPNRLSYKIKLLNKINSFFFCNKFMNALRMHWTK